MITSLRNLALPVFRFAVILPLLMSTLRATSVQGESPAPTVVPRIIFGTRLTAKDSPVVQVRRANGSASSLCTGSVIAPAVVLTAWHCVSKRAANMTAVVSGKKVRVKRVRIHPNVRTDRTGLIYDDIALLHLTKKVTVTPLAILLSRNVETNDSLRILGYGLTEFQSIGSLYQGYTTIDGVNQNFIVTIFGRSDSNSCSGDSGGPALFSYTDSSGALHSGIVGTTSTGTSSDCFYGDETNYINLQAPEVRSFITKYVPRVKIS